MTLYEAVVKLQEEVLKKPGYTFGERCAYREALKDLVILQTKNDLGNLKETQKRLDEM